MVETKNKMNLDAGVVHLVEYFNEIGLRTTMSCACHNNTNKSMFWIEFAEEVEEKDIETFLVYLREKYGSCATNGCFAMRIFPGPNYTRRRWRYMAATKKAANLDYIFFETGKDAEVE